MNAITSTRKAPDYRVQVDGTDITAVVGSRLVSLRLTDNRGMEADTLTLVLSDQDGAVDLPPTGAELAVSIGWLGDSLVDKGTFTVDEATHRGPPDRITIQARAVNMRNGLPGRKSRSWEDTTVGDLVNDIAAEHGLEPSVADHLAGLRIGSLHQTDESDLNLLTRLGERHDAMATVKAGRLLFISMARASTLSGQQIPVQTIRKADTEDHHYTEADRDAFTGVRAKWNDTSGGSLRWVLAGEDDNATELTGTYASEEDAQHAAEADLQRRQRGRYRMEVTLSEGRPELITETPLQLRGWKPRIDNAPWVATRVLHQITESQGYTNTVECEHRHET